MGKRNDIIRENKCSQKQFVPELPKTSKELYKLLRQQFKILWESKVSSESGKGYRSGSVAVTILELECPFCKMRFRSEKRTSCLVSEISPANCPNCNFPSNIVNAFYKSKLQSKKNKK